MASFQNFFLTFLGRAFLELLYREIARERGGAFLVATSPEGAVVGFAAGVPHLSRFYRKLARERWFSFGLASIQAAVRRPAIIPRLWRALRASEASGLSPCPAVLMSIAVAPGTKRSGIGKALVRHFLACMARNGAPHICLTTDRDDNAPTLGFYEALGFWRVREFQTPEGRWICEFMIDTPSEPPELDFATLPNP
ncbi:MAG: GNAT family N-acetyltransferase [Geothrix sp.]|uniref:GNAT family N-acetyltransferase n=1 Tax=Geothrix sp. TaxID=1962974 RepID=UPI0017DAA512|nr:GNAT family N-acetyltransferase [Geothrix sp.]NWJ42567.1 GNAT family N-acetyltransferase [Geothrix sp.]WIL19473.1 MAG: GNAT family N-acetyltransferase [Geothrix sp.]